MLALQTNNLGNDLFDRVNEVLTTIVNNFQSEALSLTYAAKVIAGLGLLIYVFFIGYKILIGNEAFNPVKLGKVLAIFLGITFYSTFLTILNFPLDTINNGLKTIANREENTADYYQDYKLQKLAKQEEINNEEIATEVQDIYARAVETVGDVPVVEGESLLNQTTDYIKNKVSFIPNLIQGAKNNLVSTVEAAFTEAVYEFFIFLGKVSGVLLNATRAFFLISLSTLGIFVIALSAYPGLEGSFYKWLQAYITVYIWLGISHLLRYITSALYTSIKDISGSSYSDGIMNFIDNKYILPVALAAIAGNSMIPMLANMMIQTGMSGINSQLDKNKKEVGQKSKNPLK